MRSLVFAEIIIAVARHHGGPFKLVAAKIKGHELQLFMNVIRVHRMHGGQIWPHNLHP